MRKWITISLIRHAQSISNITDAHPADNEPLTDIGKEQAEILGQKWANVHIDHFFSSTATRALDTAEAIKRFNPKAPPIIPTEELVEQRLGDGILSVPTWDKRRIFELRSGNSYSSGRPPTRDYRPPGGGESYQDVGNRAYIQLVGLLTHGVALESEPIVPSDKPIAECLDERIPHIVLVSHGIFLLEFYEHILFFNDLKSRSDQQVHFQNTSSARFIVGYDPEDEVKLKMITVKRVPERSWDD